MYPLIILLSAVLISSKFSFFVLFIICLNLSLVYVLQENGYVFASSAWKLSKPSFPNLLTIIIIYTLMTFLSWLSSREIEESLHKSKSLANKLKLQNENLEQIVEARTKELKALQLNQLTRIAPLLDLGKLSAGLIHDVREPLAVLSFILQNAKQNKNAIVNLDQAFLAVNKIDDLSRMSACKLFNKPELEVFNLNQEIRNLIGLFEYKSRIKRVKIIFETNKEFELHADRSKLNQVIANLILNALEAYDDFETKEKFIFIKLIKKPRNLLIKIKDYGVGINLENLTHIFEPNFSSKDNKKSLGFGLYVSQETMMKIFESGIGVESKNGAGSTFTLFIKNKFILNEFTKSH
jgi:signal transduction histidine kinase